MKKLIDGKIVNTDKMIMVADRICARSHSNNPIGWEYILNDRDLYYSHIDGGHDIFSPESDIRIIGGFDKLMIWAEKEEWNRNEDLLEWIESMDGEKEQLDIVEYTTEDLLESLEAMAVKRIKKGQ
jgi:hypothetical protein